MAASFSSRKFREHNGNSVQSETRNGRECRWQLCWNAPVWKKTLAKSCLREQIAEWTLRRSASARLYPASLIWCVRKSGRDLADRVESWLAWQRVQRDLIEGVLGQEHAAAGIRCRLPFAYVRKKTTNSYFLV